MLWMALAILALVAGFLALRRRRGYESVETEPWRASLAEEDEPLDLEEIRRAEEEWLGDGEWDGEAEDESWR